MERTCELDNSASDTRQHVVVAQSEFQCDDDVRVDSPYLIVPSPVCTAMTAADGALFAHIQLLGLTRHSAAA
jgi:hypothetical protein